MNQRFVAQEIEKLLNKGCIEEVKDKPRVVNPLTVADGKAKQRLVLDARHVNPHLFKLLNTSTSMKMQKCQKMYLKQVI